MKIKLQFLIFALFLGLADGVLAQDTPCECGETGTVDCGGTGSFYNSESDATTASGSMTGDDNARHTFTTPVDASSAGEYEFCHSFTTSSGQTSIAFRNYIQFDFLNGSDWTRSYVVYDASDCNNSLSVSSLSNGYYEVTGLTENTEYNFCVIIDVQVSTSGAQCTSTEFYLYDTSPSSPPAGCNADIGTFTWNIDGTNSTSTNIDLTPNQTFNISSNGDQTLPSPAGADAAGLAYAAFVCDPATQDLTDINTFSTATNGSCFKGLHYQSSFSDQNIANGWANALSSNPYWIVPITIDDKCTDNSSITSAECSGDTPIGIDIDGDGCFAVGSAIKIEYVTQSNSNDCGSCSDVTCDIGNVATYDDRFPPDGAQSCVSGIYVEDGVYTSYQIIETDANGTVGAYVQAIDKGALALVQVTQTLYAIGDCGGTDIRPYNNDDNVHGRSSNSGSWNPEWQGLNPNTQYILVTEFDVQGDRMVGYCMDYYHIPNPDVPASEPDPGPCDMQDGARAAASDHETCDCTFKDSGADSDYSEGEDMIYTLCPDDGTKLRVEFTTLDLGQGDVLEIYDGNDDNAGRLGTLNSNTASLPPAYNASLNNSSGCLTFGFTSDNDGNTGTGWEATVTCFSNCTNPVAAETTVEYGSTKEIKACIGDTITFDASTSTHNATSITDYKWVFEGSDTINEVSPSYTFTEPGIYTPTLKVVNDEGCASTNAITTVVSIGTEPNFEGTNDTTLCAGDTIDVQGIYNAVTFTDIPTPPMLGAVELPDPDGSSSDVYSSELTISGYDVGATISDANSDIISICVNMEHTFMNDLVLTLESPTGERVILFNRGGGGTALGYPYYDPAGDPGAAYLYGTCDFGIIDSAHWVTQSDEAGTGFTYCFTVNASETLKAAGDAISNAGNCGPVAAGDYLSAEDITGFNNADINGTWTLYIEDKEQNDNGFVFWWNISFDNSLLPDNAVITPSLASSQWTGYGVVGQSNETVSISHDTDGDYSYTFAATDDYGCTFDTTITVTVQPAPSADFTFSDNRYCIADTDPSPTPSNTGGVFSEASSSAGGLVIDGSTGAIDLDATGEGDYTVLYVLSQGCVNQDSVDINIYGKAEPVFAYDQSAYCEGDNNGLVSSVDPTGGSYAESGGTGNITVDAITGEIDFNSSTFDGSTYRIEYTSPGACGDTVSIPVTLNPTDDPTFDYDTSAYCEDASAPVISVNSTGGIFSEATGGLNLDPSTGEIDLTASTKNQTYTVKYVTSGTCKDSSEVSIRVDGIPLSEWDSTTISNENVPLDLNTLLLNSSTIGGQWSSDDVASSLNANMFDPANLNGPYYLTYTVQNGLCQSEYENLIRVTGEPVLHMPNAFTPNGDGLNDIFRPIGSTEGALSYSFVIFDRWGTQVYSTDQTGEGWDGSFLGKKSPNAVYTYKVKWSTETKNNVVIIGQVLLMN